VRNNIFELLEKDFDVAQEIKTIWQLFIKKNNISIPNEFDVYNDLVSILDFVNSYSFANWKSRSRCASPLDMMNRLGINDRFIDELRTFSDKVLLVLEFIINMIVRCEIAIKENSEFEVDNEYRILNENINIFIEHFGYEKYYFEDNERVVIIEKNPAAISAAEISEPETAKNIIQYNHYTLKGNIEAKKLILISFANEIEPQRNELEKLNSSLSDDLFFMFNNMNLRHNNVEPNDKNYKPYVANMDKNTLESWYDETYQMVLLAKLLLDNVARMSNIKTLKKNIV